MDKFATRDNLKSKLIQNIKSDCASYQSLLLANRIITKTFPQEQLQAALALLGVQ